MYITDDNKNKILEITNGRLVEVISDFRILTKHGGSWKGECPACGAKKGLEVCESKRIFKCFKCNMEGQKRALDYLMIYENKPFHDALKYLADKFSIDISNPIPTPKKSKKIEKSKPEKSKKLDFCARMLKESGLTQKDIVATVIQTNHKSALFKAYPFREGTINSVGDIDKNGDDAIIAYYNLDGYPVTYELKDRYGNASGKVKEYYRVRWQYPSEHLNLAGKPFKYKSPKGSGTHIYFPERIREKYIAGEEIPILYIQEGEKKAEKACKHGIPSVAVSGIQNLGQNGSLPQEIIKLVETCKIKEVVFLLDSDWNDLAKNIKLSEGVDLRPRQFCSAVKNYQEYFRTLVNRNLYIEVYFGYVLKNDKGDKGIDDLLVNSLAGKEDALKLDLETCINEKHLLGTYVQLHKITTFTSHKLYEIWSLDHPAKFAELHRDVLQDLPEFRIGKHKWRFNDKGEIESAQPIEDDEKYWKDVVKTDRSGNESMTYKFMYGRCFNFLRNRGFGRYRKLDGSFEWIKLDKPTVRSVHPWEIKDYVTEFTKMIAHEDVLEMIYCGGPQYLGPDKLSYLAFIEPYFKQPTRDHQIFYFAEKCWEVTAQQIKETDYTNITYQIWHDVKHNKSTELTKSLIDVKKEDGNWSYQISATGAACHFLQFLINTSNFTWRKEKMIKDGAKDITVDASELNENVVHLIAKLCSIGYMLVDCKDRSISKAVVAMDGKQSEVGLSNGRSGKSLVGELFKHVKSTAYINGKKKDFDSDTFLWNDITEKTSVVFIDDLRPNFDFEFLFANITGDWSVNYKGGGRCTVPFNKSAKIYLTTNHALNGEGSSFKDRQWPIAFSDFYNDTHKPIDDFGVMFFDEWDDDQWNLTWNLLATCVKLYLKYGYVESPSDRIEVRNIRQMLGEEFIAWADEYFSSERTMNQRIARKVMYDAFLDYAPEQRKWCKPPLFKKRIMKYCELREYAFNPHKYDSKTGLPLFIDKEGRPNIDDKSSGSEFFIISDNTVKLGVIDLNKPYEELANLK